MIDEACKLISLFHVLDGLRRGLSLFSGPSRAALIYAERPDDPVCVYDPQVLLRGHEPRLQEIYLESTAWRLEGPRTADLRPFGEIHAEGNLQLSGLISAGGRTRSLFYQMWFTEHHSNMCSIGPTERWLQAAAWVLAHDFASEGIFFAGTSRYVLQGYAVHALHEHLQGALRKILGRDAHIPIYAVLEAVLGISKTLEEGAQPCGQLAFLEPAWVADVACLVRFPYFEMPSLKNFRHVRKLLQAVEHSPRKLISDGEHLIGIGAGKLPPARITAEFCGTHGFLRLAGDSVCSFADGNFHSSTRRPILVQLEEALLEGRIEQSQAHVLYKTIAAIAHEARERRHGCTIVIDLGEKPRRIPGQELERPIDLHRKECLDLAKSLAKVDGALQIAKDARLYAFACLLDGRTVPGEDRSRGARYNSALRFTAMHENVIVVVVSADRPVSVFEGGVELTAQCEWSPLDQFTAHPPTLESWLSSA